MITAPARPAGLPIVRAWPPGLTRFLRPPAAHLAVLAGYLAAGIAVNWPRATYLTSHRIPATRDAGLFVWDLWWVARSVAHLSDPWLTGYQAAPVGTALGYHTLMPLPGAVMAPLTTAFGPVLSYNLLSVAAPGLLCYAMYRAARLWLPSQAGAIAAGGFFGLSTILTWNAWYELNIALGALFLPLALEAAVRLGRRPGWPRAVILGSVLGAALLTDQESALMASVLAVAALLPWLLRRAAHGGVPVYIKVDSLAIAVTVFAVLAIPQLTAMQDQAKGGNAGVPQHMLALNYLQYAAAPQQIFSPSPRAAAFGLSALRAYYYHAGQENLPITAYGQVLTALALAGLVICWRRRAARLLAVMWAVCTFTAMGTGIVIGHREYVPAAGDWHGLRVSMIMPYTWLIRIPLLSSFREADRILELGLVPLALLAGAAVHWLFSHAKLAMAGALALAVVEAGSAGAVLGQAVSMAAALPALTGPIAADHSGSVVVDIPYSVRSGVALPGQGPVFSPEAQLQATAEGHPSAIAYVSRLPGSTLSSVNRQVFYSSLLAVQQQPRVFIAEMIGAGRPGGRRLTAAGQVAAKVAAVRLVAALRVDARRLGIGWVIIWPPGPGFNVVVDLPTVEQFLEAVGFRFDYQADGALVYRLAHNAPPPPATAPGPATVADQGRRAAPSPGPATLARPGQRPMPPHA